MPATWTNTQIVDNLLRAGANWTTATVTFSFPTTAPSWSTHSGEGAGFSAATAAQKTAARAAIGLWDDLIATDFVETSGAGQITFQNTTTSIGYAHAYMPGLGAIWFNPNYNAGTGDLLTPKTGQYGFLAYMHELGHALGLDHPGEYNGGSPTYGADALYAQDTHMYTVMSYFNASNTGADWYASDGRYYYAQTPMVHDILAIQALYGVETTTRTGNTVYGFNSNAGNVLFDFTANSHPIVTIWDAAGTDTIDLSGFTTGSRINLNEGASSDCDAMTHNLWIAFGCQIENATGGSGNDNITGNALSNVLTGGAGNDVLNGGGGADTLIGGAGNDIFYADNLDKLLQFSGGDGYDILYLTGTVSYSYDFVIYGFEEMWINGVAVERPLVTITGTSVSDNLNGNSLNNVIKGLAGHDSLYGLDGNDTLIGGAGDDRLEGGLGWDTASYEDASAAVSVSLGRTGGQSTSSSGTDTLISIENLTGSNFGDVLAGNGSANILRGLAGNDRIWAGDGNDMIVGGGGTDTMTGGNGADKFAFHSLQDSRAGTSRDVIADFLVNSDKIDLSAIDAVTGGSDNAFVFIGAGGFSSVAGQLNAVVSGGQTIVSADVNGDRIVDFQIALTGQIALTASDFVL